MADADSMLVSHAIGSCILVAAYYQKRNIGAMAHIMLPGKASEKNKMNKFRYAEDAIHELLLLLNVPEESYQEIKICLVGAGNVLKRQDDAICRDNIHSVRKILNDKGLKIAAKALGGINRRSIKFDIAKAEVYFTENGSKDILLWKDESE